jgi:hypothetical protein
MTTKVADEKIAIDPVAEAKIFYAFEVFKQIVFEKYGLMETGRVRMQDINGEIAEVHPDTPKWVVSHLNEKIALYALKRGAVNRMICSGVRTMGELLKYRNVVYTATKETHPGVTQEFLQLYDRTMVRVVTMVNEMNIDSVENYDFAVLDMMLPLLKYQFPDIK